LARCNNKENRPEGFGFDAEAKISGFERALAAHPEATGRVLRPGKPRFYTMACEYHLAREMMLAVRDELPEVDAVMCHHDIMAQGAALVLMETGRQVGRDVMVSGEGKFDELRFWHPAITTTSVDSIRLNAEICRLLKLRRTDRISPPETVEIPTIISSNGE
uniref:substrate-binding domain-containing protein n=1 Tax=Victivallis vadensis TaxID=172901 RepID=UPI003AF8EC6B